MGTCTDVYTSVYTPPHLENVVRKTAEGAEETPYVPPPHHLVYVYEGAAGVRGSVNRAARKVR